MTGFKYTARDPQVTMPVPSIKLKDFDLDTIQAITIWSGKLNSLNKKNKSLNNWDDSYGTRKSEFIKRRTKSILEGSMNYKE